MYKMGNRQDKSVVKQQIQYENKLIESIDKNENWVCVWGMETDTDKKGKVDSSYLQETWRFNKDGKADLFYQFRAAATPPKK